MPVRWETLFDDLEAQLGDALDAEERDLLALRERQRLAALTLRDRLVELAHPSEGAPRPLVLALRGGARLSVLPLSFGKDWFAAALPGLPGEAQAIVPLAAVAGVHLSPSRGLADPERRADQDSGPGMQGGTRIRIADRIGLAIMLRDLARRRVALDLVLAGETVHGTLDRVGADHLDVAVHDADTARRLGDVVERRIMPLGLIEWVRL